MNERAVSHVVSAVSRLIDRGGRRLHRSALDNARTAATEASRRRVEAAEVDAFLAGRQTRPPPAARAL